MSGERITGCRVFVGFAQTRPGNIESLGNEITEWIQSHDGAEIVDLIVKVTGTETFVWHTVTVFYREAGRPGMIDARSRPSA